MLITTIPSLLLSLPVVGQLLVTFWRLRQHSTGFLWVVFFGALAAQVGLAVVSTLVSMHGIAQKGIQCVTGASIFLVVGAGLAVTVVPGVALLASLVRWLWPCRPNLRAPA